MNEIANKKETALELLLADYQYLGDSFWKNEETGETRVKFLITLVTAVMTALVTLVAKYIDVMTAGGKGCWFILIVIIFSLVFLFAIGFVTLRRIMKRNQVTDGYKKDMDKIRQRIKDNFDCQNVLSNYKPFSGKTENNEGESFQIRKVGGLTYTVAIINSFVLAALVGVIYTALWIGVSAVYPDISKMVFFIIGVFGLAIISLTAYLVGSKQCQYIEDEEIKNKKKLL